MRGFFNDPSGFHALFPTDLSADDVWLAIEEAASEGGLIARPTNKIANYPGKEFTSVEQLRPFEVSLNLKASLYREVAVFPAFDDETDDAEADRAAALMAGISIRLGAFLGRTFHPAISGGVVSPDELNGSLKFIDWIQYLGPALTSQIGIEKISTAPVSRIERFANGGCALRLSRNPYDGFSRVKVAAHFGISLKPQEGRNPRTGEPIVMPWH